MNKDKRYEIFRRWHADNPEPKTELNFSSPFELLVAVTLSAQSTDVGVNKATDKLFKVANTPQAILDLGLDELRDMAKNLNLLGVPTENYAFDFTMVRGLGYYTGPIFETVLDGDSIGSISGGGRYDDLIGIFRKESLPTTGISLGIERIITLMDENNMYPETLGTTVVDVLVTVFNDEMRDEATALAMRLRNAGVRAELYMTDSRLKLGKQFGHADKKGIPIVAVMGPDEVEQDIVSLKRLKDGKEITVKRGEAADKIRELLG